MINIEKIKRPFVMMLVGPPLSGKSTFCRQILSETTVDVDIISRDQIVLDLCEGDDYNSAFKNVDQKLVNRVLQNKLESANENSKNVIVDMTNMTSKRRRHTLSFFSDDYTKIAVIFSIPDWQEFVERNKKRQLEENKFIPEDVIRRMISSYQPIDRSEGFDRVISYN